MGWSDEGRGYQTEGRKECRREREVVGGEMQTHDMWTGPPLLCNRNTVENVNFCIFNFENMLSAECQINSKSKWVKN